MELFKGQNLIEFSERFKTDEDGKEYLANSKWNADFNCVKCDHSASQIRKNFSRTRTGVVIEKQHQLIRYFAR